MDAAPQNAVRFARIRVGELGRAEAGLHGVSCSSPLSFSLGGGEAARKGAALP
jgi:hypothetical protein